MVGIKCKASSLIEVIVALLILVLITTLASVFIINNAKKAGTANSIKAFLFLDNEVEKTLKTKNYESCQYNISTYKIIKERIADTDEVLVTIRFTIEDNDENILLERRRIFLNDSAMAQQNPAYK